MVDSNVIVMANEHKSKLEYIYLSMSFLTVQYYQHFL